MACYAHWIFQYPSNLPSFNEWDFSICHEKIGADFFYDILVYSTNCKSHIRHLEILLLTLLDNQLYAKFSKCSLVYYILVI